MKAKTLKPFKDRIEGVTRKKGDTFSLTQERFEQINSTKYGVLVEVVAEETTKPKRSPKRSD